MWLWINYDIHPSWAAAGQFFWFVCVPTGICFLLFLVLYVKLFWALQWLIQIIGGKKTTSRNLKESVRWKGELLFLVKSLNNYRAVCAQIIHISFISDQLQHRHSQKLQNSGYLLIRFAQNITKRHLNMSCLCKPLVSVQGQKDTVLQAGEVEFNLVDKTSNLTCMFLDCRMKPTHRENFDTRKSPSLFDLTLKLTALRQQCNWSTIQQVSS